MATNIVTKTREYSFGPRTLSVTHALRDVDEVGMLFDDDIEEDGAAAFDNTGVCADALIVEVYTSYVFKRMPGILCLAGFCRHV